MDYSGLRKIKSNKFHHHNDVKPSSHIMWNQEAINNVFGISKNEMRLYNNLRVEAIKNAYGDPKKQDPPL